MGYILFMVIMIKVIINIVSLMKINLEKNYLRIM